MMEHKGYKGYVEFDEENEIFHGEVLYVNDVITFQGKSVDELKKEFRDSVDDYIDFCESRGESPEKPVSGSFLIRADPDLHRRCLEAAKKSRTSLNAWAQQALGKALSGY